MPLVTDATGNDLTYKLIGLAMAVHNEIGYGFKEEVYEKAFEVKLNHAGIEPNRQYEVHVEYEGETVARSFWIYSRICKSWWRSRHSAINSPMMNWHRLSTTSKPQAQR